MALLSFLGAARQVTGSCYLIETHDKKLILLECGMQQGGNHNDNGDENGNRSPFTFNPEHLSAVVISHAHIDHSGCCRAWLPKATAARSMLPMPPATCWR